VKNISKKTADVLTDALSILLGCVIMALGMVIFTIPNNLAPGGVSGLATALAHVLPINVGFLTLIFNVPILIVGLVMFGWRSVVRTVFATLMFSVSIDVLSPVMFTYTNNVLLASVVGGVLIGAGVGILFIRNITTGGTDMITMILRKPFPQLQAGSLMIVIDSVVVLIAVFIFGDIEIALYSAITLFVAGKVIDAIMQGVDFAKIILIITDRQKDVLDELTRNLGRGVTEMPARGGFTGKDKSMLLTVARRSEIAATLRAVKKIDPESFVILYNATEVHGEGFKEINL
jgi:uncharacterized membrane-anchored protein YitT (DUF2179 family)